MLSAERFDVTLRLEVCAASWGSGGSARAGGVAVADDGEAERVFGIDITVRHFDVQNPAVGKLDCFHCGIVLP